MRKNVFLLFAASMLLSSCVSVKEIANLNIVSTRNVLFDGGTKYARLATYACESKRELKRSKAKTIEDAVNATVRNYAGGEFMSNVKVWKITKGGHYYFAVSGDIYGIANENGEVDRSHRGFSVGDAVVWEEPVGQFKNGKIQTLVDNETCTVLRDDGKLVKVKYTKLSK